MAIGTRFIALEFMEKGALSDLLWGVEVKPVEAATEVEQKEPKKVHFERQKEPLSFEGDIVHMARDAASGMR